MIFDPAKESFDAIHRIWYFGDDFKILGVLFDCQLQMGSAAAEISREAGWKVSSLLKCRRFYTVNQLVKLYKAQVLSYVESKTPAIHHAAPSVLDAIDRIQRRFLREIGLDETSALLRHKLAPLSARRDIAMLGLLHRVSHGRAPSPLLDLLGTSPHARAARGAVTRGASLRHGRQLVDYISRGGHTETLRRSTFGLVTVWNFLPAEVVDKKCRKAFQKQLQRCLMNRALRNPDADWPHFFLTDARVMPARAFQRFFA